MMSQSDSAELRQRIQQATAEMTACAETGAWEQALELVDERSRLITSLLSDSNRITTEEVALIRATMKADQALNRLAESSKAVVIKRLSAIRKGRKAAQAYADNA